MLWIVVRLGRRHAFAILAVLLAASAVVVTGHDASRALWVGWSVRRSLESSDLRVATSPSAIRQFVQAEFRKLQYYVPGEHVLISRSPIQPQESVGDPLSESCGKGKVFVWLPLKVNLPLVGAFVRELCWRLW